MILERLKAGVKNTRDIAFHGTALKLRLLSEAEILNCRLDTLTYAEKNNLDEESQAIENARRQLFTVLSDAEGNRVAESIDSFRDLLTRSEREYLVEEYLLLENECTPSVPGMEKAEFNDILDLVKKKPESILSTSNTATLRRLIIYLESRQ
ncbi:MAG: hypothetical protein ACD_75C01523G0010 [uncultured bacterium]|nr:MAG: hypothetical protein ACD_75C01523G0010 [uncultured bacterium]